MIGRMICLEMGSASWIDKRNLNRFIFAEGRTPPVHVKMSEEAEEEEAEEAAAEEEEEEEEEVGGLIRTKCTTRARHVTKKSFNRT